MGGVLVTVVFVDIERSTELLVERGDVEGRVSLESVLEVARERIEPYGGHEVKALGDGLMLMFPAPRQAVTYAVAVQRSLLGRAAAVRIGVNTGEVAGSIEDPVGEAVNAAARIAAKAAGGEVLISDVVRQLVGTVPGVRFVDRGRSRLKGFSDRWRLFAALGTEHAPEPAATFGREKELDLIAELLDASRRGSGGALFLEGEAGIGKTHLAEAARTRARAMGFNVLVAGADELEHGPPGRMIAAWADALDVRLDAVPRADDAGGTSGFALTESVTNAIEDLAATTPVLIVAEDLQWADDLSARGLATIDRRVATLPITIIATFRPAPRPPLVDQLVLAMCERGARRLRIVGLDAVSITAMTAQLVGAPPGARLAARLGGAAGNPLYVTEYLRAVDEGALLTVRSGVADVDDDALPAGVRDTILRRLTALPSASVEMLRLASLLGREFTLHDLATIAGRPVVNVAADLRAPVDAAVLSGEGETLSFRHDLVRDAVYDDIVPAIRRDLHAAAGRALAAAGSPVLQVARQLELGARPGDIETVEWLERAANETLSLDLASAVALFERALGLAPPEWEGRTRLETALLEPLAAVGRVADARAVGLALLDRGVDVRTEFIVRRGLAVVSASSGDLGLATADFAAAAAAPGASPVEAAALQCLEANIALLTGRAAADVAAVAERALADEQRDDPSSDELACIAHQTLALTAGACGRYSAGAEHARISRQLMFRGGIPVRGFLIPDLWEATFLLANDAFDEAIAAYDEARARAERRGELSLLVQTHSAIGFTHFLAGRWDDAASEIEAGMVVADDTGNRAHDIACNALLAWMAYARGDDERGASCLAEGEAAFREGRHLFGFDFFAWVVAAQLRARGDVPGARAVLAQAWVATEHLRGLVQYRLLGPELSGLAYEIGDVDTARSVADATRELADASGVASALAAATRADGLAHGDADSLVDAVVTYRAAPRRVDLALACEDASRALLRDDRHSEAVALLDEAVVLHAGFGATRDVARIEGLLRANGVKRRRRAPAAANGWDALSPTERKVVDLVAQGRSNPQIASTLFISRRTVETHVSHIFRKVGVTSRTQLAAAAVARR